MTQISLKDITVLIVTYKSSKVLDKCLNGVKKIKKIFVLDNSNDSNLKKKIKKTYKNVNFFLSKKNLGYASGNNFLLKKVKTKYALILNPDCIIYNSTLDKLIDFLNSSKKNFGALGTIKEAKIKTNINKEVFSCEYVKGFLMLVNIYAARKVKYFDENFFLYLEEIDFCKKLTKKNFDIFALNTLKFKHIGEKASSDRKEFLILRNWHWMWSQYYFYKKHKGPLLSFIKFFPKLIYLFFKKKITNNITYKQRYDGLICSMQNKKSFFRYYV
jgi:N-acetylglucosaminyl-diphospho-decaprenol L-rhamnosyltransferase